MAATTRRQSSGNGAASERRTGPAAAAAAPSRRSGVPSCGGTVSWLGIVCVSNFPGEGRGAGSGPRKFETHTRSEEHTSELQSPCNLVCRLLLEKKKKKTIK